VRWLITGGCGFIGTNLVHRLLETQEDVFIMDNMSAPGAIYSQEKISRIQEKDLPFSNGPALLEADVRDSRLALEAGRSMDVIVHLAASTGVIQSMEDPQYDCHVNVLGTLNMLESTRKNHCRAFIFASSGAPLGEQTPPVHEEMVPKPLSPYAASKLAGEGYCSAYHGSFGVRAVVLRFSNVYGPHSLHKDSVVARFIKKCLEGRNPVIYGDGSQTRDFIHVADLVNAVILAAKRGEGGQIYQIATGRETTIFDLANLILKEMEQALDRPFALRYEGFRQGEIIRNSADNTKARKALGWEPVVDLPVGIRELVGWFLAQQANTIPK